VHDTAYEHGRLFFALYGAGSFRTVVELGSQDVNGSLRDHCPPGAHYIGLDMMPAKGVDLVINPGAPLPLASDIADAVVTSSAFEHDVCFWETFLELVRILRPGGLLYVNAPANGEFHRYPLDCWRFYPDAGAALVQWTARRGTPVELIESFIGLPQRERWADFVAVFRKHGGPPLTREGRIADHAPAINIHDHDHPLGAETPSMPDMTIADELRAELAAAKQANTTLSTGLTAAQQSNATLAADLVTARETAVTAEYRAAGLERALDAIQTSTSWRLTAGLRWFGARLRRP
jgi:SAM-dependent methyltransferase